MIWLLDSIVGHVHVTVFKDKGPLGNEEILNAQAPLGVELCGAGEFRRVIGKGSVKNTGPKIKKWNYVTRRVAIQTKKQSVAEEISARMNRAAQDTFTDHTESADRKGASA